MRATATEIKKTFMAANIWHTKVPSWPSYMIINPLLHDLFYNLPSK